MPAAAGNQRQARLHLLGRELPDADADGLAVDHRLIKQGPAIGIEVMPLGPIAAMERSLTGVKLVISDAHVGLTKAIRCQQKGCVWQRCRVHFDRNLLQRVPKAYQGMVTAALRSVLAQQDAAAVEAQCDQVMAMLTGQFPRAAALMASARENVLAFRHFPEHHWKKIWSTNLLERVNEEIKRRTKVVGIFPNDASIVRLLGAVLLEQHEHWQMEGRRMFTAETMAAIMAMGDLPALKAVAA